MDEQARKFTPMSKEEILETFEMLELPTDSSDLDKSDESWYLDRKPLKIKIQTNTIQA